MLNQQRIQGFPGFEQYLLKHFSLGHGMKSLTSVSIFLPLNVYGIPETLDDFVRGVRDNHSKLMFDFILIHHQVYTIPGT